MTRTTLPTATKNRLLAGAAALALVGAGAVVGNDKVVPPRARALGVPARITEDAVSPGEFDAAVAVYVRNAHWYAADLRRLD